MPISPLETAGAQIQPTSAAPLHTNEFFTGLWTNGNPLGPGAVPFLYQRFYAAQRYDRLIDGANIEISTRLTPMRRPGSSVYNSSLFPPINRFFEFRGFTATDEVIHLLADCDGSANQLPNSDFSGGTTGWTFQAPWILGYGGIPKPPGLGNLPVFTGPGTAAVASTQHIACTPGTMISASCWGLGEVGASGTACLRINWYDASNALITINNSASVPNTYVWTYLTLNVAAPAGAAYATIDFAVYSSTSGGPRWACWGFTGGYYPTAGSVREVTQPNTNTVLWTKDPAAGRTSFVSDGNTVYAGDGKNTHKWVTSGQIWTPNYQTHTGDFIVDSNGNLEWSVGPQTATIAYIQIDDTPAHDRLVTLWFSPATPLNIKNNVSLTLSGLTTVAALNGTSAPVAVESSLQVSFTVSGSALPITSYSSETGSATTGTGISGAAAPAWATNPGQVTQDLGNQWVNIGSGVQDWGDVGPANAPIVTQAAAASIYQNWAANTWYAPTFVIFDSNGNLQQLTTAGVTKTGSPPSWATAAGATTADGTAVWTNKGSGAWAAGATHAVGDAIVATFTYYTKTQIYDQDTKRWITDTVATTVTCQFKCTTAGVSGSSTPRWANGVGTITTDGSVIWTNQGTAAGWPGAAQTLSLQSIVLGSLGNAQIVQNMGESGPAAPTWQTAPGATTTDNTLSWLNNGPYSAANTGAWIWAYSGFNSITQEITNPSPMSQPIVVAAGKHAVIQGLGLANPPWDEIILWRTQQGGSTLLYEDQFPNPGAGQTWIYTDSNPDSELNLQFPAPIMGENGNDPPDSAFVPICFYLGRIWGFVNQQLRWTGGPDTVTGAGNSTMPAKNRFTFPAKGVMLWPTSIGLIVYTTSDIWAVLGQGTSNSPFYAINFQAGIGMASQDAFTVNGSTAYAMITSHQVMSMDPGAGEVEVGFPIGDIFDGFDPSSVYLSWHQAASRDSALYVADGSSLWYRMAAVAAPESGNVWSPAAVVAAPGKVKAIASIEISPGHKILVMGPSVDGHPILMRDTTTNADAGAMYAAHATVASVVLAQPGGTAGLQFVVTEEKMFTGATPIVVKILFDEILFGSPSITAADFRQLRHITPDPPNLPLSKSVRTQRHWAAQDANTVIKCRHYQQDLSWPAENFANELYTNTIYGRLPEKARK